MVIKLFITKITISIPEKSSVAIAKSGESFVQHVHSKPATICIWPYFNMETEDWFKLKRYPHLDLPLSIKDYRWIKKYVESEKKVKNHSFLPLIHKCIVQRKYRADETDSFRTKKGERKRIIGKPKIRHIYYAAHMDSLIFSYYNYLLTQAYEEKIKKEPFNKSIVAYRKIPIDQDSNKNKCNIDFAKSAFQFIKDNSDKNLSVIIADVTSFFDHLNHKVLKKQWSKILDKRSLPEHHYNVFKALTRLRYVESDQLFNSYKGTMLVEKGVPNKNREKETKRINIQSNKYFKEKNVIAYCTKKEFLKNNLNLVISAQNTIGIPQGSPISATLANIYMWDFDSEIFNTVKSINGFYQRYSDDLIIVCEQKHEDDIIKTLRNRIKNQEKLEIHPSKTKIYRFEKIEGTFKGFEIDEETKKHNYNRTLEYLGFTFDGQRVLIKNSGFSKFYRSMKRSFRKSTSLALYSKNPDKSIFKSRLYKRFTHKGAKRKLIYRPSKTDPTKYERTKKYYWGNYLSYVYKANDSMKTINESDVIKKQAKKFWKRFNLLMKFHEKRLGDKASVQQRI